MQPPSRIISAHEAEYPAAYEIDHLGGETCVTGSCHLLRAEGANILLDCGIAQGTDTEPHFETWPVPPRDIDYLFLTHAHMDHAGRVPDLVKAGFSGEILCTHPTKELLFPMLRDGSSFSGLGRKDYHTVEKKIQELVWGFEYGNTFRLRGDLYFTMGNAGHILGSCFIRFSHQKEGWAIVFSGDLGAPDTPLLPAPDIPEPCDLLILESTYGNKHHEDRQERTQRLGACLERALCDGGKVFIPAFSLGRTQELIYEMDRLFSSNEGRKRFPNLCNDQKIPVFIDSPLGLKITNLYAGMSRYWNREALAIKQKGDHPMDFSHLYAVKSHSDHKRLLEVPGPAIIIAGSGMCNGGRIVDHLTLGLPDPRNDILFVGHQCHGTPGRELCEMVDGQKREIHLQGKKVNVRAGVHQLSGYSAHADQSHLLSWVSAMKSPPDTIKLIHGDRTARTALAKALAPAYPSSMVIT